MQKTAITSAPVLKSGSSCSLSMQMGSSGWRDFQSQAGGSGYVLPHHSVAAKISSRGKHPPDARVLCQRMLGLLDLSRRGLDAAGSAPYGAQPARRRYISAGSCTQHTLDGSWSVKESISGVLCISLQFYMYLAPVPVRAFKPWMGN